LFVNASELPREAKCWKAAKIFSSSSSRREADLAFRIAVTVAGEATPDFVRDQIRRNFAQLWVLIADARDALAELPFARGQALASDQSGPVAVIEASAIADLLVGRSGVRRSARPSFLAGEAALCAMACDGLANVILPDLLQAVCATIEMSSDDLLRAGDARSSTRTRRFPARADRRATFPCCDEPEAICAGASSVKTHP